MALPRTLKLDADSKSRLGTQLIRLSHRYERALAERLSRWGLAPTHYELLKLLYAAPDYSATHSAIARAMGVTLPSVTLAVRKLGGLKLIGGQRGTDRRQRVVSLSVKGAEFLAQLFDAHEGFTVELFDALNDHGAAALEKNIQRLLARLSAMEDLVDTLAA